MYFSAQHPLVLTLISIFTMFHNEFSGYMYHWASSTNIHNVQIPFHKLSYCAIYLQLGLFLVPIAVTWEPFLFVFFFYQSHTVYMYINFFMIIVPVHIIILFSFCNVVF
uniref:Uncharacterized protein n=1 Tax=Pyxicephalus adspersus TaxID=30357 RepID=A0AAV3AQP2_PYXAD|nr:TPA: hypothetical protein GDO54_009145 [Pyxicephalus adspersus]